MTLKTKKVASHAMGLYSKDLLSESVFLMNLMILTIFFEEEWKTKKFRFQFILG
jgi:hypothetical protein